MMYHNVGNAMNLQATLSASSATTETTYAPHHPITCASDLHYDEDGTFACEHATVPAEDGRTQSCLNHSLALLIIELAYQKL